MFCFLTGAQRLTSPLIRAGSRLHNNNVMIIVMKVLMNKRVILCEEILGQNKNSLL